MKRRKMRKVRRNPGFDPASVINTDSLKEEVVAGFKSGVTSRKHHSKGVMSRMMAEHKKLNDDFLKRAIINRGNFAKNHPRSFAFHLGWRMGWNGSEVPLKYLPSLSKNSRRSLRKNSSPYSKTIIKMLNSPIVGYSKGKISPNRYQAALVRFGDGKLGIMIGWWNKMGEFVKTPGSWRLESLNDVGDAIAIDYGQEWAVKGMRGAVEEAQSEVRGLSANPFKVGGYLRETPKEAGYRVVQLKGRELILQDKSNGRYELYVKSPGFAGAAIYYKGNTYEFVSSTPLNQLASLARHRSAW